MKTVFSRIMLYIAAVISYCKINVNIVFLDAWMQHTYARVYIIIHYILLLNNVVLFSTMQLYSDTWKHYTAAT